MLRRLHGCGRDRYALLLEDVSGATVGDQLTGAALEQAERVIDRIAPFHANWWASPELAAIAARMPRLADPMYDYIAPLWDSAWPPFLDLQAADFRSKSGFAWSAWNG